jgi:hypothetical protein
LKGTFGEILFFRAGLAEALDAVAFFPLAALPEKLDAFITLEDRPLRAGGGGKTLETVVLGHAE